MLERPFPQAKAIGLDIETTGLDWRSDEITLVTLSDGEKTFSIIPKHFPADHNNAAWVETGPPIEHRLSCLGRWLRLHVFNRMVIVHNTSFDLPFLDAKTGCGFPTQVWDTMIAEQLLTAGLDLSASLAETTERRLGITLDKSLQTSFDGGDLTEAQLDYATQDAKALVPLARVQHKLIQQEDLATVWEIEQAVTPVFCKMLRHGICLDKDLLEPVIREAETKRQELQTRLQVLLSPHVEWLRVQKADAMRAELDQWLKGLETETKRLEDQWDHLIASGFASSSLTSEVWGADKWGDTTIDKKDGKPKGQRRFVKHFLSQWRQENPRPPKPKLVIEPINLDSVQQVMAALTHLGVDVPNLSRKSLQIALPNVSLEIRRDILLPLLDYKKVTKLVSAFGDTLLEKIVDGKVYPQYRQYGTATGRPSCTSPNLLQVPAEASFRQTFRPDPGHVMVVADYSGMELRIVAELSGDVAMVDAFQQGQDLHTATAQRMLGKDEITDKERKLAKTLNFLTLYGGGAEKLRMQLADENSDMTKKEAQSALDRWREVYSGAWGWIESQQKAAVRQGYTATALGRKRRFVPVEGPYQGNVERAGGNHPIQGSNADCTKMAMVLIDELLTPIGGRVVAQVYDEIVASVPQEHADYGAKVVQVSMEESAKAVLKRVPVKVDVTVSRSWSEDDAIGDDNAA